MSRSRQNLNIDLNFLPSKRKLDDYSPLPSAETLAMGRHHHPFSSPNPNPARVIDDSSPSSSSSSSSSTVQFFVRTDSKTVVVHSPRESTVASVISRALRLSGAAASPDQYRLIYRGRQLDAASTLSASHVASDSTLHLAARLRSTRLPRSHRLVDDLLFSASCLLRSRPAPREIDALLLEFLASTPAAAQGAGRNDVEDTTVEHLSIFSLAAVPAALVGLYLSDRPGCRLTAERAVRLFLRQAPEYVPKPAHLHCSVIVLEFCKLIAATCGRSDQLYVDCRSALAALMEPIASGHGSLRNLKLVVELYHFVSEVAGYMIEGIESDEIDVCPHNLSEFASFLAAMRTAIRQWLGGTGDGKISKSLLNDRNHPMQESWIRDLREVFVRLLRTVDECLRKHKDLPAEKGPEQGETVLAVLSSVHKFSKIYEDGHELLDKILVGRRDSVNVLVRRAKRNEKLKWMLKYKKVTDFESRRNLTMMLFPEGKDDYERMHEMLIDRLQLLPESFEYIGQVEAQVLHGGLFVEFKNESATGPGVLREWFTLVCRALFNPQNVLFLPCPNDRRRFFPNPASVVDPLHLKYFGFCGRVIALALLHKVQLGVVFDRAFFLQLAGAKKFTALGSDSDGAKTITLEDVRDADPCLYMSCKKILEMDAQLLDSDALGLTFVREIEELGTQRAVELCPGGKDIVVNSKNRKEYINLLMEHRFVTSTTEQVSHFARGFSDILSNSMFQMHFFRSLDLEDFDRMLGGSDGINVSDWRAHTEYSGYKVKDRIIGWFWKIVEGMSEEQRRVLLFFWTSVKYLPVDGFGGLSSKLYIYKIPDSQDRLPTSHTCFYRLCLPQYPSISVMRDRLQFITQEHVSCSFGMW